MSSPSPPYASGMAAARKPARQRSRQLSTGFWPAWSYSAARGAMRSRVSRSTRSTRLCGAGARAATASAHAADRLARGGDAAAGADLVQLDHVAEGVLHEDLLRLRPDDALGEPVLHAEAVEFPPRLLDVGDGQGDVRPRRILVGPLGEPRLPVHAHQMDLRGATHVHPVPVDGRDVREPRIGIEPEHVVVEREGLRQLRLGRTDADAVVME